MRASVTFLAVRSGDEYILWCMGPNERHCASWLFARPDRGSAGCRLKRLWKTGCAVAFAPQPTGGIAPEWKARAGPPTAASALCATHVQLSPRVSVSARLVSACLGARSQIVHRTFRARVKAPSTHVYKSFRSWTRQTLAALGSRRACHRMLDDKWRGPTRDAFRCGRSQAPCRMGGGGRVARARR